MAAPLSRALRRSAANEDVRRGSRGARRLIEILLEKVFFEDVGRHCGDLLPIRDIPRRNISLATITPVKLVLFVLITEHRQSEPIEPILTSTSRRILGRQSHKIQQFLFAPINRHIRIATATILAAEAVERISSRNPKNFVSLDFELGHIAGMADHEEISEIEELFYEGTDLQGEGRHDEALACFEKCLKIDPNYGDAILGKAMVCLSRDQLDDAIRLGKQLVELDPNDVLAYTNLSMFYQRAGRIEEAEEAGAQARMLDWKRQIEDDES